MSSFLRVQVFQGPGTGFKVASFQGKHSFKIFLSEKLIQYGIMFNLSKYKNIYKLKDIAYQIYKQKIKKILY